LKLGFDLQPNSDLLDTEVQDQLVKGSRTPILLKMQHDALPVLTNACTSGAR